MPQEILGRAGVHTTLATYTHTIKRKHDDSAGKMAELAGLNAGTNLETFDGAETQEAPVSDCFIGSRGWNRTNDQRINSPTLYR